MSRAYTRPSKPLQKWRKAILESNALETNRLVRMNNNRMLPKKPMANESRVGKAWTFQLQLDPNFQSLSSILSLSKINRPQCQRDMFYFILFRNCRGRSVELQRTKVRFSCFYYSSLEGIPLVLLVNRNLFYDIFNTQGGLNAYYAHNI